MNFLLRTLGLLLVFLSITLPTAADDAKYKDWKHSGSVWIITTPEGADLPATAVLEGFPLLVRLQGDFFDFKQSQPKGEDLRVTTAAGEPLACQIEDWNAEKATASIWVRVPKIQGNSRQELKLYWGNAAAASESNGKAVFNESNGYLSVWHMNEVVQDEVGTLPSNDVGTTTTAGRIGIARYFPGKKGIFSGDKIPNYPSGAATHSTEAWFRCERPNVTLIGWGNEGGGRGSKVRMQLRSPPHLHIDSDFSDVKGTAKLPLGEWLHVMHTYSQDDGRIYINGQLDASAKPRLDIKTPARLWLGGWYNNYDFVGDLDEVRISQVARSADWIKFQYENQKVNQTAVGPVMQEGRRFAVFPNTSIVKEGSSELFEATVPGAQMVVWKLVRNGKETVVATNTFVYRFQAGRITGNQDAKLICSAIYPNHVKSIPISIGIKEAIPNPDFTLEVPSTWNGNQALELVPEITNLRELMVEGAKPLNYTWTIDNIAVTKKVEPGKLILTRAHKSGIIKVSCTIDNGGEKVAVSKKFTAIKPLNEPWVERTPAAEEQPEDNQFFARNNKNEGTLHYTGTLAKEADTVFVRLFADDQLVQTELGKLTAEKKYAVTVKLKPGLIKYRTEFGVKTTDGETVLHTAKNLVCGDAYLIDGQSNAVATDIGKEDPDFTSDWIRTFGSMAGDPNGARLKGWSNAVARDRMGGKGQIGYWGVELAKRLVENQKLPICIINGAVGGSRIDVHQRNHANPTDVETIYGRLLWRVQEAKLTHGIRGVFWHQGENDQGADGPTGGYGWETYRDYFIDMSAAWKEDYPNLQQYYMFQIWPKACSMGSNGSDNRLREVQRTLPTYFSNLHIISTLGIKPPGGCHFPAEGYAQFAKLIGPLVERDHYGAKFVESITAPNLLSASFTSDKADEIALTFDQEIVWNERLVSQFYLVGDGKQVASGAANGNILTLKLQGPATAKTITYLDSASWSPENLLFGKNGIAALTFCDVAIEIARSTRK